MFACTEWEFRRSMSDFKPGDFNTEQFLPDPRGIGARRTVSKVRRNHEDGFPDFLYAEARNTRNGVQGASVLKRLKQNFKEAMFRGSQGKNQNQAQRV